MSSDSGGSSSSCRRRASLLLLALLFSAWRISAAPGDLDPTFGVDGVASFDLKIGDFAVCAAAPTDDGTSVLVLHTTTGVEIWSVDAVGTAASDRSLAFSVSANLDCSFGIRDLVCPEGETVCYGAGRLSDSDEDSWLIAFDWTTWTLVNGIVSGGNQTIDSEPMGTDGFDALAAWAPSAALTGEPSLGAGTSELLPVGRDGVFGSLVVKASGSTTWKTVQIDGQSTEYKRIFVEGDCAWAQGITQGSPSKLFVCKYCRDAKSGEWAPDTSFGVNACWKEDLDGRDVEDFTVLGGRPMLLYTTTPTSGSTQLFFRQIGTDGGTGYPATERFSGRNVFDARFTHRSDPSELPRVGYSWGFVDTNYERGVFSSGAILLDEGPRNLYPGRTDASAISLDFGDLFVEMAEEYYPKPDVPSGASNRVSPISGLGPASARTFTMAVSRDGAAADANLALIRFEVPHLLFYDGFHTGDTSAWSAAMP